MLEYLDRIQHELIDFRRLLHSEPELSFQEIETTNKIASLLDQEGIEYKRFPSTTGLVVDIKGGEKTNLPLILLRADIDALPITDLKTCEYKSKNNGVMHACGHDVHITIVIGVLRILNNLKNKLDFNLRVIFQPAEELGTGAAALIKEGITTGVDYALALHVDPIVPLGKIAIRPGPINAAVIEFAVKLSGKSSHVARIHQGIDTIGPACNFINTCYSQIPKKIDAREQHILYFGLFNSGTASNIVSKECNLLATIRTFKSETAASILDEVKKIANGITEYSGVQFDFTEKVNLKAVINNKIVSDYVDQAAEEIIGRDNIISDLATSMGGEDFGEIMSIVPGAMMRLGVQPAIGIAHGLHTSEFDIPESAILLGAKILTQTILKISNNLN